MSRYADLSEALTGFPLDKVTVFDTETTGLNPWGGDEIIQISILDGYGSSLFSNYIKPVRKKSWPEAQKVNGISPFMVRNAPTMRAIAPLIKEYFGDDRLVVGYNLPFDLRFLSNAKIIDDWVPNSFDVMREYATIRGTQKYDSGNYRYSKLSVCAKHYGYEFNAHDALEDAKATAYCYRALLRDNKYLSRKVESIESQYRSVSISQTTTTTSNILELLEGKPQLKEQAEIVLGEVTRGKNKGKPRYECMLHDKCVGVGSPIGVLSIRTFLNLSETDPLPEKLPVDAAISFSGSSTKCSAVITAKSGIKPMLQSLAKKDKEEAIASLTERRHAEAKTTAAYALGKELGKAKQLIAESPTTEEVQKAVQEAKDTSLSAISKMATALFVLVGAFLIYAGFSSFGAGNIGAGAMIILLAIGALLMAWKIWNDAQN